MNGILTGTIYFALVGLPQGFLPADGRCLENNLYPQLAEIMQGEQKDWPYGRCDQFTFKLPNLSCKPDNPSRICPTPLIKVTPLKQENMERGAFIFAGIIFAIIFGVYYAKRISRC
jgi:hypothetical protein